MQSQVTQNEESSSRFGFDIDQILSKFNGFNGNPNLKPFGIQIQYTNDQLIEYARCAQDPIYFIKNYCWIVSVDDGLVKFNLYDYQKRFITALHNNRRVISIQPRQMGKSQTVAAYILWFVLFNEHKTVAILANKAAAAREIMSRVQDMYESIPIWMQQGIKTWNKGDIELENGSKAFTAATSRSSIRGRSINLLYIDEAAIIPNNLADEFYTSAYPVVSSGETTKIVLTSTPLGYNHFWKFWTEAEHNINGFVPVRVKWQEHPKRDSAWAEEQRKLLGELKFNQEVECAFLGSAATLISAEALSNMVPLKPIYTKDGLDIFEAPEKGRPYILVADTARGVGGDYSAFSIIDVSSLPYKLVAKYRDNKISPLLYPSVIYRAAMDYFEAFVLVEINDNGQQIADILYDEYAYENIFSVGPKKGSLRISSGGRTSNIGLRTTKQVKRIGCSNLKTLIETNKILIHCTDTIAELTTFIEIRGSYKADEGKHDDLVMPLVLFAWLTQDPAFSDIANINLRKSIFESRIAEIEADLTPFGFISDGQEDDKKVIVEDGAVWEIVQTSPWQG